MDPLTFGVYTTQFLVTLGALAFFEHANRKFVTGEFQRFVHTMAAAVVGFFFGAFFLLLQLVFPPGPFASLMTFLVGFCFVLSSLFLIHGSLQLLQLARSYGFADSAPLPARPAPIAARARTKRKKRS